MVSENKRLKMEIGEELEFSPYTPTRQIFVYKDGGGKHIQDLVQMCINAHTKAGIGVRSTISDSAKGTMLTFFDNGDIVMAYKYGAQIEPLRRSEVSDYTIRVFMDSELPDSAIRACIEDLGLRNYLIGFGLCDNSQGGK